MLIKLIIEEVSQILTKTFNLLYQYTSNFLIYFFPRNKLLANSIMLPGNLLAFPVNPELYSSPH